MHAILISIMPKTAAMSNRRDRLLSKAFSAFFGKMLLSCAGFSQDYSVLCIEQRIFFLADRCPNLLDLDCLDGIRKSVAHIGQQGR
jgi:hypothetical protein